MTRPETCRISSDHGEGEVPADQWAADSAAVEGVLVCRPLIDLNRTKKIQSTPEVMPDAGGYDAYIAMWKEHEDLVNRFQENPPVVIRMDNIPWPPCDSDILDFIEMFWSKKHMKHAYRIACRRWHPDKFMQAYGEVVDPTCREAVDQRLNSILATVNRCWEKKQESQKRLDQMDAEFNVQRQNT
mmetsp:Transcript_45496/g.103072  ORF Transcript_45496/g.103072 Transcript_45496/m.103072 type:complete len:185 (+) Transcript_45496:178-732(+)